MANEPIPIDDVFTDLDSQWNASNVTKPSFITVKEVTILPKLFIMALKFLYLLNLFRLY